MPAATASRTRVPVSDLWTVLSYALSAVGVLYQWGGNSLRTGVDCSGLVQQAFRAAGYNLPRVSQQQAGVGFAVEMADARPGDLILYDNSSQGRDGHIAIYLGDGRMLEAPGRGKPVRITGLRAGGRFRRVIGAIPKGGEWNVERGPNNIDPNQFLGEMVQSVNEVMKQLPFAGVTDQLELLRSQSGVALEAPVQIDQTGMSNTGVEALTGMFQGTLGGADLPAIPDIPGVEGTGNEGGAISLSAAYQLAKGAGATDEEARILAAIAAAESSLNPRAHNPNASTGDNSYGLWQINMLGQMGRDRAAAWGLSSYDQLFDPATNAQAAVSILRSQGFRAWSVYKSGAYRQHLGQV